MADRVADISEVAVRGGFFLFAGSALSMITLGVGSIVVARLLGPEDYGLYGLSLIPLNIFGLFTDFGVSTALTRFSAKFKSDNEPQRVAGMLKSAILFKLLLSTAIFILCLFFSETLATQLLNRPSIAPLVRLASIAIPFQLLLGVAGSAFLGLDHMEHSASTTNVQSIVKAVFGPVLILLGFGVVGALMAYDLSYAAAATSAIFILFFYHYRSLKCNIKGARATDTLNDLRVMLSYGFPLYVSGLLGSVVGQYQSVILAWLASNADIGNLNVATNFLALAGVISAPTAMLFPAFSKLNSRSPDTRRLFELSVKYTSLLLIPMAVGIPLLSKDLILAVYGPSFAPSAPLLSTLAVGYLFAGIGSVVIGSLLTAAGEMKLIFMATLINLAIFVPLAPLLIWLLGVLGVVLAGLTSGLISLAYQMVTARKKFGISFSSSVSMRIYLASAASAAPILPFLQLSPFQGIANVILGGCLYLFVYMTALPVIGAIRMRDIENLEFLVNKSKVASVLKPFLEYETKLTSRVRN